MPPQEGRTLRRDDARAGEGGQIDASPAIVTLAGNLRSLRERAGLTLAELAAQAGIGKSTLAQLESGRANPSVETVFALAIALRVPLTHLLSAPTPELRVVRRGEGIRLESSDAVFHATLLASTGRRGTCELFTLEFEPRKPRYADPHQPGAIEHVFLTRGRLRVGPADQPTVIEPGDLASFDADVPHVYEALRAGTAAFALLDYPT